MLAEIWDASSTPDALKVALQIVHSNESMVRSVDEDEELFDAITRAAFEQRRKTLVNALSSSPSVPYGKEEVKRALNRLGFSESVRGEKLSVADFAALSDALTAIRQGLSC